MNPNPANDKSHLRDETGVRQAALFVIDELGENAAAYAATRAIFLQNQGDVIGASAWRRIAPLIVELQRKSTGS